MSKNSSYIWRHNLLQTNLNNKPTTNAISQTLKIQETKQSKEINCCRKLPKTANTTKRYATTPKDKFRTHNCLLNNRATRRNVTRTLHFNANSLYRRGGTQQAEEIQYLSECKYSKNCRNHQTHNLHMNCKGFTKMVNLPNPSPCHQHFVTHMPIINKPKSCNTFSKTHALCTPCNNQLKCLAYVPAVPLKMNKNHCHHAHLCGGKICNMIQIHDDVKLSVSNSIQLSKYPYHHCHHHHDGSQLTCLSQVSQHQEHLLGTFEVLSPLFLLKPITFYESMKTGEQPKNQHQNHCLLERMEHQQKPFHCCSDVMGINRKMFQPFAQRRLEYFNLDYDRILKYLKTKCKPSDGDVIFGNACLLLSKRYGWETSRIEWLLQLEQNHETHTPRSIANHNKC